MAYRKQCTMLIDFKNSWVILVETSLYWHNYRHLSNTLYFYEYLISNGLNDDKIIFFSAMDSWCNSRNIYKGHVVNTKHQSYCNSSQIDFIGDDVTVENFMNVLTDDSKYLTKSQRLLSDEVSTIYIFLSGHGGDGFLKFRDNDELSSEQFASGIYSLFTFKKYKHLVVILDTCQAITMKKSFGLWNITFVASSQLGENSFAYGFDNLLNVALIDRFSYKFVSVLGTNPHSFDAFQEIDPFFLFSHPSVDYFFTANASVTSSLLFPKYFSDSCKLNFVNIKFHHCATITISDLIFIPFLHENLNVRSFEDNLSGFSFDYHTIIYVFLVFIIIALL